MDQSNVITVSPLQPCGCSKPSEDNPQAICGKPARAGVIYASMILPICEECARDFAHMYGITDKEQTA